MKIFHMTPFVVVFSGNLFPHVKLMLVNNSSHLKLRGSLSTGLFFSQTLPIRSINGHSGRRPRLSVEKSLASHGSVASLGEIQRLGLEGHLALTRNVPRLSTNLPSANTFIGSTNSFRNTASQSRTYITWTRRGVREVVGARGQVRDILYLADDDQSTCHVAQTLSSSQLSNVSVQMARLFSQDLSSQARNSAQNGLWLTPRLGEFRFFHELKKDGNMITKDFDVGQWMDR